MTENEINRAKWQRETSSWLADKYGLCAVTEGETTEHLDDLADSPETAADWIACTRGGKAFGEAMFRGFE